MDQFFEKHLDIIVTALLGALAWANEKRKIRQVEKDGVRSMQQAYEVFVRDMNNKYADVKAELVLVRKELEEYKIENRKLKQEIQLMMNGVNVTSNIGKGKRNKK